MKTKKSSNKILPLVSIEPLAQVFKSNMPPTLTGHLLLRRSVNFWTLADLARINRALLYKDPKGLAFQVIVPNYCRGACWTWKPGPVVQYSLGVIFCYFVFSFPIVKPLMPILALLPMLCVCENRYYGQL